MHCRYYKQWDSALALYVVQFFLSIVIQFHSLNDKLSSLFSYMKFMSEKMMKKEPDQALPITAGLVTVTALFSMFWCLADDWMREPGWQSMGLPGLFFDPKMRTVVRLTFQSL